MSPKWYLNYNCPYYYRDIPNVPRMPIPSTPKQQPQQTQQPAPTPPSFEIAPGSPISLGPGYTQYYLKQQIGKRVKVTFLIGTNTVQDRDGILLEVGISYLDLKDLEANFLVMGDLYSVKFVNIYPE